MAQIAYGTLLLQMDKVLHSMGGSSGAPCSPGRGFVSILHALTFSCTFPCPISIDFWLSYSSRRGQ